MLLPNQSHQFLLLATSEARCGTITFKKRQRDCGENLWNRTISKKVSPDALVPLIWTLFFLDIIQDGVLEFLR